MLRPLLRMVSFSVQLHSDIAGDYLVFCNYCSYVTLSMANMNVFLV